MWERRIKRRRKRSEKKVRRVTGSLWGVKGRSGKIMEQKEVKKKERCSCSRKWNCTGWSWSIITAEWTNWEMTDWEEMWHEWKIKLMSTHRQKWLQLITTVGYLDGRVNPASHCHTTTIFTTMYKMNSSPKSPKNVTIFSLTTSGIRMCRSFLCRDLR